MKTVNIYLRKTDASAIEVDSNNRPARSVAAIHRNEPLTLNIHLFNGTASTQMTQAQLAAFAAAWNLNIAPSPNMAGPLCLQSTSATVGADGTISAIVDVTDTVQAAAEIGSNTRAVWTAELTGIPGTSEQPNLILQWRIAYINRVASENEPPPTAETNNYYPKPVVDAKFADIDSTLNIPRDVADLTDADDLLASKIESVSALPTPAVGILNRAYFLTAVDGTKKAGTTWKCVAAGESYVMQQIQTDLSTLTDNTGLFAAKVDKVTGYGLSKNDFTDEYKAAVNAGIKSAAALPSPASGILNHVYFLTAEDGDKEAGTFWRCILTEDVYSWEQISIPGIGSGGDFAGIALAQCTDKGIVFGELAITLNWTDPEDVVLNGATLATWNKTVLIRKVGGYPENITDGTQIAETSRAAVTKNYYRDNPVVDEAVEDGVTYYYKCFSQTVSGTWNDLVGNCYATATALSWSMWRAFIRANNLEMCPQVGDLVTVDHGEYALNLRVVGYNTHTPADETLQRMVCLLSEDILFNSAYDGSESAYGLTFDTSAVAGRAYYVLIESTYTLLVAGTDYEIGDTEAVVGEYTYPIDVWYQKNDNGRVSYGSNRYSQSNIDQFLNADALKGAWFEKKNPFDVLSSTLANKNGLLFYLDPAFKECLTPVRITTALAAVDGSGVETISRKVFLPSMTEIYGTGSEGAQFSYYVGSVNADKIKMLNDVATAWWLRSPNVSTAHLAYLVQASGASSFNYVNTGYGVPPAFALG